MADPDAPLSAREARDIARAIRQFDDELFANAEDIDPRNEMDWSDMAFGFLVGAGVPPDMIDRRWLDLMQAGDVDGLIADLEKIR